MLHVAGLGAVLAIGDPIRIGLKRIAPAQAVRLTLEAPQEHDLIDRPTSVVKTSIGWPRCRTWIGMRSASYNLSQAPSRPGAIV